MKMTMKKYLLYFLLSTPVLAVAQDDTVTITREEFRNSLKIDLSVFSVRKEIISSRDWAIKEVTRKDEAGNFRPKETAGAKIVFNSDGTTYTYITPEQKSAAITKAIKDSYEISENEITMNGTSKKVFVYELTRTVLEYEMTMTDKEGYTYHFSASIK
jgi:polyribonucleotide nucleotidyltransferase